MFFKCKCLRVNIFLLHLAVPVAAARVGGFTSIHSPSWCGSLEGSGRGSSAQSSLHCSFQPRNGGHHVQVGTQKSMRLIFSPRPQAHTHSAKNTPNYGGNATKTGWAGAELKYPAGPRTRHSQVAIHFAYFPSLKVSVYTQSTCLCLTNRILDDSHSDERNS